MITRSGGGGHSGSKGSTGQRTQVFPVESAERPHGPVIIRMKDGKKLRKPIVIPIAETGEPQISRNEQGSVRPSISVTKGNTGLIGYWPDPAA